MKMVEVHKGNIKELMAKGFSAPPKDILEGIMQYGEIHSLNLNSAYVPKVFRLPSLYTGSVLVVGGERKTREESLDRMYTINFDPDSYPDIHGMAKDTMSLVAIPNCKRV